MTPLGPRTEDLAPSAGHGDVQHPQPFLGLPAALLCLEYVVVVRLHGPVSDLTKVRRGLAPSPLDEEVVCPTAGTAHEIRDHDDRKLQPLGSMDRHDPDDVVPFLDRRGLSLVDRLLLHVPEPVDKCSERQEAALLEGTGKADEFGEVGDALLPLGGQ